MLLELPLLMPEESSFPFLAWMPADSDDFAQAFRFQIAQD